MPYLDEFHQANQQEGFVVIAVSIMENINVVRNYVEAQDYKFPILLDTTAAIAYEYQVKFTPTTYFINKEGKIVDFSIGPLDYNQLKEKF